jgi:hypothetical protein
METPNLTPYAFSPEDTTRIRANKDVLFRETQSAKQGKRGFGEIRPSPLQISKPFSNLGLQNIMTESDNLQIPVEEALIRYPSKEESRSPPNSDLQTAPLSIAQKRHSITPKMKPLLSPGGSGYVSASIQELSNEDGTMNSSQFKEGQSKSSVFSLPMNKRPKNYQSYNQESLREVSNVKMKSCHTNIERMH